MARPIIIFTHGRCGSNHVMRVLSTSKKIKIDGEVTHGAQNPFVVLKNAIQNALDWPFHDYVAMKVILGHFDDPDWTDKNLYDNCSLYYLNSLNHNRVAYSYALAEVSRNWYFPFQTEAKPNKSDVDKRLSRIKEDDNLVKSLNPREILKENLSLTALKSIFNIEDLKEVPSLKFT